MKIFKPIVALSPAAKLHIALILMIGSEDYLRAEYFLRILLSSLKKNTDNSFRKLGALNLQRIRHARKNNLIFNEKIIYYHQLSIEETPVKVYATEMPESSLIDDIKMKFFVLDEAKEYFKLSFDTRLEHKSKLSAKQGAARAT